MSEKEKKSRALTEEELVNVQAGVDLLKDKVSEKTSAVITATMSWYNEDEATRKANRVSLLENFENVEALKEYLKSDEFAAEISVIRGMSKINTILNLIISYYTRDVKKKSTKKKIIRIEGKTYSVNAAFFETLSSITDAAEKRKAILEHADTKEVADVVEEF